MNGITLADLVEHLPRYSQPADVVSMNAKKRNEIPLSRIGHLNALASLMQMSLAPGNAVTAMSNDEVDQYLQALDANKSVQYGGTSRAPFVQFAPNDPARLGPHNDWLPDFNGFQGEPGSHGLYWLKGT